MKNLSPTNQPMLQFFFEAIDIIKSRIVVILILTLSAISFNVQAQCVDLYQNSIDCCCIRVEIHADCGSGDTTLGILGSSTGCSNPCCVPLGTTSSPTSGAIDIRAGTGSGCGPGSSLSLWCANNPGCSISFKVISISTDIINLDVPTNGSTVDSPANACCGSGNYHFKVNGNTLKLWYDCP